MVCSLLFKDLKNNVINVTTREVRSSNSKPSAFSFDSKNKKKGPKEQSTIVKFMQKVGHGIKTFLTKTYNFVANLFK